MRGYKVRYYSYVGISCLACGLREPIPTQFWRLGPKKGPKTGQLGPKREAILGPKSARIRADLHFEAIR